MLTHLSAKKFGIASRSSIEYHHTNDQKKSEIKAECSTTKACVSLRNQIYLIPLFLRYFAFHETLVLLCGAAYRLNHDVGVVPLSVVPGLSIIAIFFHFLRSQFRNISPPNVAALFFSTKFYVIALILFIFGAASIVLIFNVNTFLSLVVPADPTVSDVHIFINKLLIFPYEHSSAPDTPEKVPFNYRIQFVGSLIAPVVEETTKYLLLFLTLPFAFIWDFSASSASATFKNQSDDSVSDSKFRAHTNKSKKFNLYFAKLLSSKSLLITFMALSGAAGIAIMENIGYLAACEWSQMRPYCLPNRDFDILGAGLARGIFSVPFHCITACAMADVFASWIALYYLLFEEKETKAMELSTRKTTTAVLHKFRWSFWVVLSYPISIAIPFLLHANFNFWMRGMPFVTGIVTITGACFVLWRILTKYFVLTDEVKSDETNGATDQNDADADVFGEDREWTDDSDAPYVNLADFICIDVVDIAGSEGEAL